MKLESGSGTILAGSPSSGGFGVGGQSYSDFLASPVGSCWSLPDCCLADLTRCTMC